jgi:lysophospholipase L1-like esterase
MRQRLIALGDSITLGHWDESGGWLAHVRRKSDERVLASEREEYATVYNLGISSDTSRHVLGRYRSSAVSEGTTDHLVEPPEFEANMRALITLARQDASRRVLVVGPTPVDESKTRPVTFRLQREYRLDFIEQYNEIARATAAGLGVPFADLFAALRPHDGHWQEWDGVHLNSSAHGRVAEFVDAKLRKLGWGVAASLDRPSDEP